MDSLAPRAIRPTGAFVFASWSALIIGITAYLVGLYNASMSLSEKGYYLCLIMFGLFAAVSLQKSVRDKSENIPVTGIYLGLCWFGLVAALSLLIIGLWHASLLLSEKGFYGMSFTLSLFAAVTVQKNVRDLMASDEPERVFEE